jgi:hypothetical protein
MNEVLDKIKSLLQDSLCQKITSYYKGEVIVPPKSYLPALMVIGNSTNVVAKDTCNDQFEYDITIRVVVNVMEYVSDRGTGEVMKAQEDLINIMEARNEDGSLASDSVIGVLRANVRTNKFLYNNDITAEYRAIQTGEFFYVQAEVSLSAVTDLIPRPIQS